MKKFSGIIISIITSILGMVLSVYLWYLHYLSLQPYCPTGGCEEVLSSKYGLLFGIPLGAWGLLFYFGVLLFTVIYFTKYKNKYLTLAYIGIIIFGFFFSIYLRYIEFFIVHHICIWCWVSFIFVIILNINFFINRRQFVIKNKSN